VQVSATKAISNFTGRVLFLGGLFVFVIMAQGAIVSSLRGLNIAGGPALLISGAVILPAVLIVAAIARARGRAAARKLEAQREAAGLPQGACCVVLRPQQASQAEFPWELRGDVRAAYPKLAKRLGIEGYALVDFEIGADGAAKNLHCIDVWPAAVFYEAAAEALAAARFALRPGAAVRFGPSYRIPFVFRIRGAAKVADTGRSAITPLAHGTKRTAVTIGRGLWRTLKYAGVLLIVLLREIRAFLGWCAEALAGLLEKIAAHLRNLKRT
jgi:TonB family protein